MMSPSGDDITEDRSTVTAGKYLITFTITHMQTDRQVVYQV